MICDYVFFFLYDLPRVTFAFQENLAFRAFLPSFTQTRSAFTKTLVILFYRFDSFVQLQILIIIIIIIIVFIAIVIAVIISIIISSLLTFLTFIVLVCTILLYIPANIYLFKVNNRSTRKRYEVCSKLTIKK